MRATVYADNAATTQLDKKAFDAMVPWLLDEYGNASQPYAFARKPKRPLLMQEQLSRNALMRPLKKFFYIRWYRKRQLGDKRVGFFRYQ